MFMGVEYTLRLSGTGAKNLAGALWAVSTSQQKTKGKARLASMLKSGKELKVFTVAEADLAAFSKEAKRYGVLYAVIKDVGNNPDAVADVMVRAEDAAKINRIVERLGLGKLDGTNMSVASERNIMPDSLRAADKGTPHKDPEETLGEITGKPPSKEGEPQVNPMQAPTGFPHPSERLSKSADPLQKEVGAEATSATFSKTRSGRGFDDAGGRESVKTKIKEKRASRAEAATAPSAPSKDKQPIHQTPTLTKNKGSKPKIKEGR